MGEEIESKRGERGKEGGREREEEEREGWKERGKEKREREKVKYSFYIHISCISES